MTIDVLKKIDDELIIDVIDGVLKKCAYLVNKTPIPKTIEAMLMLLYNIIFIKNGIFILAKDDNQYALSILTRSLYEHFVRHLYLFTEYVKTKDDSAGLEYFKWTDIKEYIDYFNSLKKKAKLEMKEHGFTDIDELISKIYSGYKEIPSKDRQKAISSLSFFNMLHKLAGDLVSHGELAMLKSFPTDYSILSSYVHGGPHANRLSMFNANKPKQRAKAYFNSCKKAYTYTIISLMNTFIIAGQYDDEILRYVPLIKKRYFYDVFLKNK